MTHQRSVCLKQFDFVSKLRRHQLTHSGQRPFTCSVCRKAFRQSTHLKRHLESHMKLRDASLYTSKDSQVTCINSEGSYGLHLGPQATISDQTEISENNLNHVRDHGHSLSMSPHTQQQNYAEGRIAEKQMSDFVQWNYSELTDMAEAENDCPEKDQCSESNRTPDRIQPGLSIEKREQPSIICSYDVQSESMTSGSYKNIAPAKMDKMTKPHQCSVCMKVFSAPSKLRRHMLIHTSQRPFGCQLCTKAFRQLTHLKIHMTTHFSQRKIKTQTCSNQASKAKLKHFVCNSLSRKLRSAKHLTLHQPKQVNSVDKLKAAPAAMNKGVNLSPVGTNDKTVLGQAIPSEN
uniref:C2H2-type domain-containing protein n=1 Tax=Electrophorus electricus TaxID=8005 RepID=A0AAY5ERC7_ELEEL